MVEKLHTTFLDNGNIEYRVKKCKPSIIIEGDQGFDFVVCEIIGKTIFFKTTFRNLRDAVSYSVEKYRHL